MGHEVERYVSGGEWQGKVTAIQVNQQKKINLLHVLKEKLASVCNRFSYQRNGLEADVMPAPWTARKTQTQETSLQSNHWIDRA
ncbi:hypothetical protein Y1Q_0001130 [Alligator mississippiensis]|uniref:Uncharacterized protein n=1 Tax=Alligator mississippiensis TaxID=8496 RepID=A0A151M3X0_ALLMI|nr:hypothetical protein Y1Q_0001130 [Alligator mississippiensis]